MSQSADAKIQTYDSCFRNVINTKKCGNGTEYLLWLKNKHNQAFHLMGDDASYRFIERPNGDVYFVGRGFTHSSLPGDTITVELVFSGATHSPPSGSPKYNNCGSVNTAGWTYFTNTNGTIKSKLHGTFSITRKGPAFQLGDGANMTELGFGASGWLNISGGDGYYTTGDVNMMLSTTCYPILPNKMSGYVFGDEDTDGKLDNNETRTPNVDVNLYTDLNCDGVVNGEDELIETQTTDNNGYYEFNKGYTCNNISVSTFTKQIVSYACDAEEYGDGRMDRYSGDLDLGKHNVGIRYKNVNIPQGATIVSARLKFKSNCTSYDNGTLTIYGNDVNSASGHSSNNYDITSRTKTDASVQWSINQWYQYHWYSTPDISDIVQEIVNRPGWSSGNYMHFIIPELSSGKWSAYSFDCNSSKSVQIEVVYVTNTCDDCYVVRVDQNDLPQNCQLTTAEEYDVSFNGVNNCADSLNFGCHDGGSDPVCQRTVGHTIKCTDNTKYLLYLVDKNNDRYHLEGDASTFKWTELADGSVSFQAGGFTHPDLANDTFSVDVVFSDATRQAPAGSPKRNYCTTIDTTGWIYYETITGVMTSTANGNFDISRTGPAFQFGEGANTTTEGFGASGWIDFSNGNGEFVSGDFNMMLSKECSSNETNKVTGVVYTDLNGNGSYNDGEEVQPNTTIRLFKDINCDGVVNGSDSLVDQDVTGADGSYTLNTFYECQQSTTTFRKKIVSGACDSEETNCYMNTSSSDLDLGQRHVGLRFRTVTVPQGATIVSAKIRFYSKGTSGNNGSLKIYGEDTDDASSFNTHNCNITNRTKTSEYATWNLSSWNGYTYYYTPDIANVVQEIVNRTNWSSGNDMAFIIPQVANTHWRAFSIECNSYYAPKVEIVYTAGGCTDCYVIDLDGSTIPTKTIISTDSSLTTSFNSGGNCSENNNFGLNELNIISGTVFLDPDRNGVLELADETVSGKKIVLFDDPNCNGQIDLGELPLETTVSGADGTYEFVRPYICDGGNGGGGDLKKRVTSLSDDAEEDDDGDMTLNSSDLDLSASEEDFCGVRFTGLNIPQGATITEAYIQFEADDDDSQNTKIEICGEDTDDASTFTSSDYNISGRDRTSAKVTWTPSGWIEDQDYRTPNLREVVEEVVGRTGWSSGNAMSFIFKNIYGERDAKTINGGSAPILYVKYSTGTGGTCDDCYNVKFVDGQLINDSTLSTPEMYSITFDGGRQMSMNNDFGYWFVDPVPVELILFKGYRQGEDALLLWSTATEVNNSHFDVLRSFNGVDYEKIGEVAGQGNTSMITQYEFIDQQIPAGKIYYQLRQVDYDGKSELYGPVILQDIEQAHFEVFPIPARGSINIVLDETAQGSLILEDANGKVLSTTQAQMVNHIDISSFRKGIYTLRWVSPDGVKVQKVFIH
jgi:hypothetical protein